MEKKKNPVFSLFSFLMSILAMVVILAGFGLGLLTLMEYQPLDEEPIDVVHSSAKSIKAAVKPGAKLSLLTWNVGYCGLSESSDFFMDGGTRVVSQDEQGVRNNLLNIENTIEKENPDVTFLQEVDRDSARTYGIDEAEDFMKNAFPDQSASYAHNFKVLYIPYPIPPIGHVEAGILTLSKYRINESTRVSLPCSFKWPVRTVNLKRCLDVSRVAIKGSDKKLVLINTHMEAYDEGEGKIEQTRQLADLMQREYESGNYVIAGGDFNQSFPDADISAYPVQDEGLWQSGIVDGSVFSDDFSFVMDTSVPTCRSLDRPYDPDDESFQYYMLDGYIVSDNIKVESVETIDCGFKYSDHNPVKLVVSLEDEE